MSLRSWVRLPYRALPVVLTNLLVAIPSRTCRSKWYRMYVLNYTSQKQFVLLELLGQKAYMLMSCLVYRQTHHNSNYQDTLTFVMGSS
jgi:hypothetical protein